VYNSSVGLLVSSATSRTLLPNFWY